MVKMNFEGLVKKINLKIKAIAARLDGNYTSFSEDDLYQEAVMCLWKKYNANILDDNTESYIVQGCSFDMRNHTRTNFKGVDRKSISAYTPINEEGDYLLDMLPGKGADSLEEVYDTKMTLRDIHNKLNPRESLVLKRSSEGLTTREIGRELGVSHVMVVKIKKKIRDKCSRIGIRIN